jgi:hypothetical protein
MPSKYGFVYIWYDRKHKRYYIGCHWGSVDDRYICSSRWMRKAYARRPQDFKRKILENNIEDRSALYDREQKWLNMIKPEERKIRYYNLHLSSKKPWHQYDEHIKTVGQKISEAKKGVKTGPMTEERRRNISEAKKKGFAERGGMTDEHKNALTGIKKPQHTEEWKKQNSERMKEQWADGTRKKAYKSKSVSMTKEEQGKLCSNQLKSRWADPVWAENQRAKLKESWKIRKSYINNT